MDTNHFTALQDSPSRNEIWSISLKADGSFLGPARLELSMPLLPGYSYSNPVSDLTFSPTGTMIVAERSMFAGGAPGAHNSRVIEFVFTCSWVPAPSSYDIGCLFTLANSAGGVDLDLTPTCKFRVWATGDALHFGSAAACKWGPYPDLVYGLQGFPAGGGNITKSVLIDLNAYTKLSNKMQLGDVKRPCTFPDVTGPGDGRLN